MLSPILEELDARILGDPTLVRSVFDDLVAVQRELRLVFGDRPTCPFLCPHIITRSQYDQVSRAANTIAAAVETLVARALIDEELLAVFSLRERETKMARIDSGYTRLCASSLLNVTAGG